MFSDKLPLSVYDYLIFGTTLAISASFGVFFQYFSKKKTNEEYLLAGKDMSLVPVVMSLMATFMSATTLMGIPAEMYLYGTYMAFMNLGFIIGPIISAYVFLPIYFTTDISTVYEYLEKRFGKKIRLLISTTFIIQVGMFTSATLYAPALALSAVTNLSMWISIISIGAVCTFYCTLGGMKAVLWADVFQAFLMFVCLIIIIIKGSIDLGGIGNIFSIANEGGRLIIPRFSMDMNAQYTMINVLLQGVIITICFFCGSQTQVQRLRTLKNISRSRLASFWCIPFIVIFHLLCCFCGFIFYAYYRDCDPMTAPNKPIHSADQLMPYYITSTMNKYPGLPGLCIAGIFSASLSTVSSILNSLAAVTVQDFIEPIWPKASKDVFVTKITSLIYGVLCIAFSFVMASLGNLVRMSIVVSGMIAGPNLGAFILAACTRKANEPGAIIGVLAGIIVSSLLSFLPNESKPPFLPVSNECSEFNMTYTVNTESSLSLFSNYTTTQYVTTSRNAEFHAEKSALISVSYMWVSSIALIVCLVVGYLASLIISCFQDKQEDILDEYLSPVRTWFSRKTFSKDNNLTEKKIVTIYDTYQQKNTQQDTKM